MTTLTEGRRRGEFLVSEANGHRSRETDVLIDGQDLEAGTVLGRITASGKLTQLDPGVEPADGSEDAAAILFDNVSADGADAEVVIIARDAEVNGAELVWPAGMTEPEKTTALGQLADAGIIVR